MRYTLDSSTRLVDDGTVVIGGSPLKLIRLTSAGAAAIRRLAAGEQPGPGTARLLDRLVDSGLAHPCPDPTAPGTLRPSDVTFVIPAYRADPTALAGLVAGLRAEGIEQIVVVDDASPEPIELNGAAVLRLPANVGPGGARNRGAALVVTPVIGFLDADTVPEPGWLAPLLAQLTDPRCGLVAPRIRAARGTTVLERFEQWHSPLDLGPEPARVRSGTRVSYVPAAALLIRSAAFEELGGFDPELRFGEDVDLVWRLDQAGWRCRYEPTSVVGHRTRPVLAVWVRQRFDYGTSAAPLAARHPGALAPVRLSGWSVGAWALGVLVHPLAGLGLGIGSSLALAPKLRPLEHPVRQALRLAGLGNVHAGRILASALTRAWWPIAVLAACGSRRARRALLAAALVPTVLDLRRDRPALDPVRTIGLRLIDDAAYGAGLWRGAWRHRSIAALLPDLTSWPGRRAPAGGQA